MADDRYGERNRDNNWRNDREWGERGASGERNWAGRGDADRDRDYRAYSGRGNEDRSFGGGSRGQAGRYGQSGAQAYGGDDHGFGGQRRYAQRDYDQGYGQGGFGQPGDYYGQHGGRQFGRQQSTYGYSYDTSRGEHHTPNVREGRHESGRGMWDRASDEVSSWFGDDEARRRRQWDAVQRGEHGGRGPKGYKRSDQRIQEDVNDRLTDDSWLDASSIEVAVKDREVTLSGMVKSRDDKRRAEHLAEQVSGVDNVQNNLRVEKNDSWSTASSGAPNSWTAGSTSGTGAAGAGTNDKVADVTSGRA